MISRLDDNLKNHIVKDDLDGISLLITLYAAGSGDRLKDVYNTNFNLSKDRAYYTNKKKGNGIRHKKTHYFTPLLNYYINFAQK